MKSSRSPIPRKNKNLAVKLQVILHMRSCSRATSAKTPTVCTV